MFVCVCVCELKIMTKDYSKVNNIPVGTSDFIDETRQMIIIGTEMQTN